MSPALPLTLRLRRSRSPSKSPMRSLSFEAAAKQGTRTRRSARSPSSEQQQGAGDARGAASLGLSSKDAFSAAPKLVSMNRGVSADTGGETTTKLPELESMTKKFCVKCGKRMGVEYQFCQVRTGRSTESSCQRARAFTDIAIDCQHGCTYQKSMRRMIVADPH